jgi:putative peptide zinc metalloprotease protein
MNNESARLVQLRRDLEHSSQQHQGKSYLVVKDPITRRYFRFTESQASILDFLKDEPVDAATLASRASEQLGASISAVTMEAFFDSLESKNLLDTPAVRDKLSAIQNQKLQDRNLLYWKIASINPERVFNWLLPRTRWAFTAAFQVFAVLSIATGLTISYLNWERMRAGAPNLLSLSGLLMIWPVVFLVVTIHEFSHGLTCCHFGGKVHEVGFMLIYFQPAFFCDVSDSWMFPSRRNRMLVTLAGGYVQLVVWGLCTVIWRITDTDTFINQVALIVVVFSGLQTLVNFNPLIKLDGYYMLSDYLEIPNLRSKAVKGLWDRISGRGQSVRPFREERAQVIYGIASAVFSTTLLIYVYSALYTWATSRYAFAGLVGFLMFSTVTLRKTAAESFNGIRAVASRAAMKRLRNGGIAAAALLVAFVGHWDLKISANAKILARNDMSVRAETAGIVAEVLVHEGSQVKQGDVLARLRDFDKQQKVSETYGVLQEKRSALALLRAGARPEEIEQRLRQVETKQVEVANTRRNQEEIKRLQQVLQTKSTQLELDKQDLARAQESILAGVISRAELQKAENTVKVRESGVAETEDAIKALQETADRDADLKNRELEEARSFLRLVQAGSRPEQIRQLEAEVAKLEAQLELLKQELAKGEIKAPIDGVVTTPFVDRQINQYLESGAELCRIADTNRVTAEMLVPEKEFEDVRYGNPVTLRLRSFPSREFAGRVEFIAPVAQTVEGAQMVTVRADLPNEGQILKPEMTGVAKIYGGEVRIIDYATRRLRRWVRTEFWDLLP